MEPAIAGMSVRETALFAAGCFWGTEGYFRQMEGEQREEALGAIEELVGQDDSFAFFPRKSDVT